MPDSAALELSSWRRLAAEASAGSSSDEIYTLIEKTIEELNLGGRVLDYGAGTGNLARRLAALGRFQSVYAADILRRPAHVAPANWIEQDLNEPIQGFEGYFNSIVAAEVIEHLENPRAMARSLFRLCRPGGVLIVTMPNNESWRALVSLLIRGHYVAFNDSCYPAHITALLRQDLRRILGEAGFEPPRFRFTPHGAIPGLTRISWQRASGGLLRGRRFSDGILALARKPA